MACARIGGSALRSVPTASLTFPHAQMARREAERRDGRVPGEEPCELAIDLCSLGPPGERLEQRRANTLEAHADFAAVVEEPFGDGWAVAREVEDRRGILVGKWVESAGNVTHRLLVHCS